MPELNQDYIVPGIAKVAPELVSEAEKAKEADGDDVFTLAELDNIIASQGKEDPGELIKDRFLCKKGAVILAKEFDRKRICTPPVFLSGYFDFLSGYFDFLSGYFDYSYITT